MPTLLPLLLNFTTLFPGKKMKIKRAYTRWGTRWLGLLTA